MIFENKGEAVGVSNPHPHCQIYATNFIFKTIETEARVSQKHLAETGRVLFRDILKAERRTGGALSVRTTRRSPFCHTSRATPTKFTSRRSRRTPA
jgi:UDPglucose--hexose-1-phosphate uridylyltransferase